MSVAAAMSRKAMAYSPARSELKARSSLSLGKALPATGIDGQSSHPQLNHNSLKKHTNLLEIRYTSAQTAARWRAGASAI